MAGGDSLWIVSSPNSPEPNGNFNPPTKEPVDNTVLLSRIELCIIKVELSLKESTKAREAAEEARDYARIAKVAAGRVASDHMEIRTGFPVKWKRRIALTAFAASIGAISACIAMFIFLGKY